MRISWDELVALERAYGDSFYLVDLARFRANFSEFGAALRSHYPLSTLAYSYKTNYSPRYCQVANELGGYAEVVSRLEYDLAIRVGVSPARIIFNGPYKTEDDIAMALSAGALINLDAPYMIELLERVAAGLNGPPARVGLRCNFASARTRASRFGFDADSDELHRMLTRVRAIDGVTVCGLHCHFAGDRSTAAYGLVTDRMLELARQCFPDEPPAFLDLGGGYFSPMPADLAAQFEGPIPSYEQYAEAIAGRFARTYPGGGPELVVEPGVAITADTAQFATRVLDLRQCGERTVALVAGGIHNIKPSMNAVNLPVTVVSDPHGSGATAVGVDLVGYTCMEVDVLYRGLRDPVRPGDFVVFDNVGAYTNVMKPPFIRACPPMLARDVTTSTVEVLKRAETLADVFATYEF